MFRWLADENFNGDIVRGMMLRDRLLDLHRVPDAGLAGASDTVILEWAAADNRIVLTHDRATMPRFAFERVQARQPMPGVIAVNDRMSVGRAIEELLLVAAVMQPAELAGRVLFLPV